MRSFQSTVVERNAWWEGQFATEPFEVGWASEAVAFLRVLETRDGAGTSMRARVQISPDGMAWCDEGTAFDVVQGADVPLLLSCKIENFGNWLRIVGDADGAFRIHAYWALKS